MYYKVLAKCGHVGRNYYILKWFYVKAENKKAAALKVRNTPRVKHHQKDAIRNVVEIVFEEYINGLKMMESDMYFHIDNSSDQRKLNCVNSADVVRENICIKYKKERNGQRLRNELLEKEWKKEKQGGILYDR